MWKELLRAAVELLYPPRRACPLCAGFSPESTVCPGCRRLLASYASAAICPVCGSFAAAGDRCGAGAAGAVPCAVCRNGRDFDLARAAGPYEGPLREAVHRFKYRGQRHLARPLGALMAEVALREPAYARTGALLPVPLSPGRERQRGFNQALLLACELEGFLQAPVLEGVVVKTRETPPQTRLPRRERLRNLLGSFTVVDPDPVRGKIITIVDDVFTTGSTVSIISQLLRQAGAAGILVLTLAGTHRNDNK